MALVTVSSIYQSLAIGIFMILSTGWSLLHYQMSRDYATRVTVLMGVTYLSYSAYYVSIPNSPFRIFMEVFLIFSYSYIFYISMIFLTKTLSLLNRLYKFMENNNVQHLLESTLLKCHMIDNFMYISVLFFISQIVFQGLIPLVLECFDKSLYFTTTIDLFQQI